MELSPSWEAASCAAIQEIPKHSMEPENSLPCSQDPFTGSYLSQTNPSHTTPSNL
jgi:hypothetical protein